MKRWRDNHDGVEGSLWGGGIIIMGWRGNHDGVKG